MAVSDWSTTASDNATADPAINWQEGQPANTVNNSARAMMAAIAQWRSDLLLGACRLVYVSTTSIRLDRFNGTQIFVDGKPRTIPSGGVTLANTGLTAATLYYVYAYMSAATPAALTLEASTTARATDATYGHQIKSGDATRSLVGMVYMDAGTPGTFADTPAKRYVASWFNRQDRPLYANPGAGYGYGSTSTGELNSNLRVGFVSWLDDPADVEVGGEIYQNTAGGVTNLFAGLDGAIGTYSRGGTVQPETPSRRTRAPFAVQRGPISEGFHYVTALCSVGSGTVATYELATEGNVRQ